MTNEETDRLREQLRTLARALPAPSDQITEMLKESRNGVSVRLVWQDSTGMHGWCDKSNQLSPEWGLVETVAICRGVVQDNLYVCLGVTKDQLNTPMLIPLASVVYLEVLEAE